MNAPKTSGATPTGSQIAGQNAGSIPAHASPMIASAPGQVDLGAPPAAIRPEWVTTGRTTGAWGFPSIHTLDTDAVLRSMRPTDQIAVQVARGAAAGQQSISIALRPTELGEVSVRIDLADGNAKVRVEVERPETLKLVQTDARHLERALSEAGIRVDQGNLQINLRDPLPRADLDATSGSSGNGSSSGWQGEAQTSRNGGGQPNGGHYQVGRGEEAYATSQETLRPPPSSAPGSDGLDIIV